MLLHSWNEKAKKLCLSFLIHNTDTNTLFEIIGAFTKLSVSEILVDKSDSRPHPETVIISPSRESPTSAFDGKHIGPTNSVETTS